MKLFKKLMAGAMAIAMLSAYTVAFATGTVSGVVAGSVNSGGAAGEATVSGSGKWAGAAKAVFLMKLPTTAAASTALAFTVDPEESIEASKPANAISPDSSYGSVIFSTVSGTGAQNTIYKAESAPLRVVNMSSVDVTVNMFASLSDTKMTLSTTSGFTADSTEHLYLGVQVATVSGGTPTVSGGALPITGVGAKNATVLKCAAENFVSVISGGEKTSLVSGASGGATDEATAANNLQAAGALPEDSWNAVQYTVIGASNGVGKADWQIEGLDAPNLTITWKIDPSNAITYKLADPATATSYQAQLDKNEYKAGETVTIYVKPTSSTAKLSSVTLTYIALNTLGDKTGSEKTVNFKVDTTVKNGTYSATLEMPKMARSTTPKGDATYKDPVVKVTLA